MKRNKFRLVESYPIVLFACLVIIVLPTSARASCDTNESAIFSSFDGRISQSTPTDYEDSRGEMHTIVPNTFILHLYFSKKSANDLYNFAESHRNCYVSLYANNVFIARKSIKIAFMLDEWSKYIDQFIVLVDKSKSDEKLIGDAIQHRPIDFQVQIQQEM
ncbi:hypothetical protein [Methylobacterium oryzisoli]|uniref:hypothetical protein n=1 Tax=Methylobacterium oryzisoli TaxID=3385502 RepID=UPI003892AB0F